MGMSAVARGTLQARSLRGSAFTPRDTKGQPPKNHLWPTFQIATHRAKRAQNPRRSGAHPQVGTKQLMPGRRVNRNETLKRARDALGKANRSRVCHEHPKEGKALPPTGLSSPEPVTHDRESVKKSKTKKTTTTRQKKMKKNQGKRKHAQRQASKAYSG